MKIDKYATAIWQGGLKDGQGSISTESGTLDNAHYSFTKRFEDAEGTNPEELVGAAHAGCFAMALSMILGEAGYTPNKLETKATITLEKQGDGFAVTKSHLNLSADIPKISQADFEECATKAKENCPLSKLLNADISLDAKLA